MPTIATLFTGGNLFGIGAVAAGFDDAWGIEYDDSIASVARLNGFHVHTAAVEDVDYDTLPAVDHIHASTSCRNASVANANGGETEEDITAANAVCRAIVAHAAKGGRSFSLENVWNYRSFENCFPRILQTLTDAGFVWVYHHVNMADFGVPQTRKRLILQAVHTTWRHSVKGLRPTHGERGGIALERWNGWLDAVKDILHTFPATTPAPWQLQRLPKALQRTVLLSNAMSKTDGLRERESPAFTVTGEHEGRLRALLVGGGNCNTTFVHSKAREANQPAFTLTAGHGGMERAMLIGAGGYDGAVVRRHGEDPAFTMTSNVDNESQIKAFVLDGQQSSGTSELILREEGAPMVNIGAGTGDNRKVTAWVGQWVKIPLEGLARFQTVPDTYRGLTTKINGNGVPPRFAQYLMETFR